MRQNFRQGKNVGSLGAYIYSHDMSKRKERNDFFSILLNYCDSNHYGSVLALIKNKMSIILCTEILFDKIKTELTCTELANYSPAVQCWSQIVRIENEFQRIVTLLSEEASQAMKPGNKQNVSKTISIEFNGQMVRPDVLIEDLISSLALSLTLLAHTSKWFNNDKELVFPVAPDLTDESVLYAAHIPSLAMAWQRLSDISLRCVLFGGQAQCRKNGDLNKEERDGGIKEVYYLVPDFSDFEKMDFIAARRSTDRSAQHFFEMALETNIADIVVNNINEINSIDDNRYLTENEVHSLQALSILYCDDVTTNKTEYHGLTIREWVRGYACLAYIVSKSGDYLRGKVYQKEELICLFNKGGLSEHKALLFIKMITFGLQSRDFFDKPLLSLESGEYYLFHPILKEFSISGVLTSVFSQLEIEVKSKGKKFEESILNKLHQNNIEAKAFKFKRDNNEYEYDAIFIMDKRVFVVECKNRSISGWNAIRGARFKKFLTEAASQVKRLVDGLLKYPEVFREHFGKEITEFEVIPLVMNGLPFSYSGRFEDIYVSDSSSFGKFLGSDAVDYIEYEGKDRLVCNETKLHRFWVGAKPCSADLIKHLENPVHLDVYSNNIEVQHSWVYADKATLFMMADLKADMYKGMEIKFGL